MLLATRMLPPKRLLPPKGLLPPKELLPTKGLLSPIPPVDLNLISEKSVWKIKFEELDF